MATDMTDTAANRDALLLRELTWVRELARRLLADDTQVDDVVQDAWVAARQQPQSFLRTSWRAWLAAVVHNRVRRIIRTERRRTRREQVVARAPVVDSTLDVLARGEVHRELMVAVMELDEPYRSAVLLRFLDGLSGEQVAERQGISAVAARKRVSRGLQMLRERLGAARIGGFAAWRATWIEHVESVPLPPASALSASAGFGQALAVKFALTVLLAGAVAIGVWRLPYGDTTPLAPPRAEPVAAVAPDAAPVVEREAVESGQSSEVAGAGFVQIVDQAQRAVPGVSVFALAGGRLLQRSISDAGGRVATPPEGTDEILLARSGAMPCSLRGPAVLAERRWVLAAGERVAGLVVMPAGSSTELHLHHDRPPVWAGRLSPEVSEALAALGITEDRVVVPLPGEGRFAIEGLAPSWSGRITLADGWSVRGPRGAERGGVGSTILLFGPREDLSIEAIPPVFVSGTLVCAGVPVIGVPVQVVWWSSFGTAAASGTSDALGGFSLGIGRSLEQSPSRIRLVVGAPGDGTLLERELAVDARNERIDIGAFELGAPLVVQVADGDGRAIAGARVAVPGTTGELLRGVTDESGAARFAFRPKSARHVSVAARGHRTRSVSLGESASLGEPERIDVVLQAGNGLDVLVQVRVGDPTRGLRLRIEADRTPFVLEHDAVPSSPPQPFRSVAAFDGQGRVELPALVPGVLLHLAVLDAFGRVVVQQDVVAPSSPRVETVRLTVVDALHEVVGWVRSAAGGLPVPNADLHFETDGTGASARSNLEGRFDFGAALASPAQGRLVVDHPLFAASVASVTFDPAGPPHEVWLAASRVLRVRVLRPGGAPVLRCRVDVDDHAGVLRSAVLRGDTYYFDRAQLGGGSVTALLGGHPFRTDYVAGQDVVEVRVPELGQLSIDASSATVAPGERLVVRLEPLEGGGQVMRYAVPRDGGPTCGLLQLDLLPGAYDVELERVAADGGKRVAALGAAVPVAIRAGETSGLVLPGAPLGR